MSVSQQWYKNAVIYAMDVGSFLDTDGDGTGDFPGLLRRLDYLATLGITCIWLMPFYPSTNRDNGYDVVDYYTVEARLGSLGDVAQLIREATNRGIQVIVDLVAQHTSHEHPWFQAARANPDSKYRDYYIWRDQPPAGHHQQKQVVWTQDEQDLTPWTYDEAAEAYYLHHFYDFEPDLNLCNPEVEAEIHKVMEFWLQLGVSGFRIDAAPYLGAQDASPDEAGKAAHPILRRMRDIAASQQGDTVLIGEVDAPLNELAPYFGDGHELHMLFNFYLNNHLFLALARECAQPLADALRELPSIPRVGHWVNWVRNYDELDLERLRDDEREEVFKAFAPDPDMRIYGRGIRRRLAPMLHGDRSRMELAYSLLFSLPGSPCLFIGEEIGMGEDLSLEGRESVRTPMQWTDEPNAGFSTADRENVIRPVISDGQFGYQQVNVIDQRRDPNSFLNWMRRLISVRRQSPEIGWGEFCVLNTDHDGVLAHALIDDRGTVIVLHNLSGESCQVHVDLADVAGGHVLELFSDDDYDGGRTLTTPVQMNPYGYRWFRCERFL